MVLKAQFSWKHEEGISVAFGHCVVLQGDYTNFVLVKFFSSPLCSHVLSYGVVFFCLAHQVCAA